MLERDFCLILFLCGHGAAKQFSESTKLDPQQLSIVTCGSPTEETEALVNMSNSHGRMRLDLCVAEPEASARNHLPILPSFTRDFVSHAPILPPHFAPPS